MVNKDVLVKNFSKYAHLYDNHAQIQNRAAQILTGMLPKDGVTTIFEIGCGTGNYTALLKDRFNQARIKAIDISEAMICIAKEKTQDLRTDLMVGDVEVEMFDGTYDLVTSNATFHWLSDHETIIKRASCAIPPSGLLAFSSFGPATFSELKKALSEVKGENVSIAPDLFPSKTDIEGMLGRYFGKVDIAEQSFKETYQSLAELLNKIKYSGTRGSGSDMRKIWSPELLKKVEKKYLELFGSIDATYQVLFCKTER